ncbi:MAG: prolyl oligopeptidase family serine peptidase [Bacteroidota bacterium]
MKKFHLLLFTSFFTFTLCAQNQSTLSLSEIMKGHHFVGHPPQGIYWGDNSQDIYFTWNPNDELRPSLYRTNLQGASPKMLSIEERKAHHKTNRGTYNNDRTAKVYVRNGDLFLLDLVNNSHLQITNTVGREGNPSFSVDGQRIFYTSDNNSYAWSRQNGQTTQLTDFRKGNKKSGRKRLNAQRQWLEDDQLAHFDILQLKKEQRAAKEAEGELLAPKRPKAIYLKSKRVSNIQVSPDGRFITYQLSQSPKDAKRTKVPDFVTEQGYLKDLNSRPKVGSPQTTYERGIYDVEKDTSYLIDPQQIEGIFDKPDFLKEYVEKDSTFFPKYKKAREVIMLNPVFNSTGSRAVIVVRSMDNKDRWIMDLNMETGKLTTLDRQRDEAWIGGPGISGWNFSSGNIGWMKDDQTIWFQSEATGYSHLYSLNIQTGKKRALTEGNFEIIRAQLSNDKSYFYFMSNEGSPHEQHFYRMKASSGKRERITSMEGNNEVYLSPDEKSLAIRYSFSNKPWELYVMPNQPNAKATKVTDSTTDAFKKYAWRTPEIIQFEASDGVKVPARLYRGKNGTKDQPAVIFVHGAGYLQNVHKWWSNYFREYMFHNLLADNGYTVLDIDYRASNGYGRDWRTAIYRHMGGKDLSDQVDGANYLVEELGVDKNSIGIYGGSYGGFITIFALFNHNDVFKCGAALRSVTDWAHYNHGYTANILNTPVEDPKAFQRSSPIYFADNFNQGRLVMLHGMVDTNVQFQDVVRLSQRLIELGKTNWDVALFPMEGHGFVQSSSWADEYRRIFELFESSLKGNKGVRE